MAIQPGAKEERTEPAETDEESDEVRGNARGRRREARLRNRKPASCFERLLYRGVLPRYAFPTDVATFHVFDEARSVAFPADHALCAIARLADRALANMLRASKSGFRASAIRRARSIPSCPTNASTHGRTKRLYCECSACGFASTFEIGEIEPGRKTRLSGLRRREHVRRSAVLVTAARLCSSGRCGGSHIARRHARDELCHARQTHDADARR